MKALLIVLLAGSGLTEAVAQVGGDQWILKDKNGLTVDTLGSNVRCVIKSDTVTRFKIGKSSSPDHCSNFSIIREVYLRDGQDCRLVNTRTIKLFSKCSSLWNEKNIYCLRSVDLTADEEMITVSIADDKRKLRVKLKGDDHFEAILKNRMDRFIRKAECNGVLIE